ncbi:MAG: hypothetical protein HY905_09850 [Deltaproteobacteria bacterium]|nr:hypothetical protein [Deltaproteobacteria bacterium]
MRPAPAKPAAKTARPPTASGRGAKGIPIPKGLGGSPGRRLTKWHLLGIGVLAFGLGYLVCRIADWAVTSDEERIAAQLATLGDRARAGELSRLLEDVDLGRFGFSVRGYGETWSFGANDEEKLLDKAREWSTFTQVRTMHVRVVEDDVRLDGDRARASADLLFEENERPWRQPVRFLLRKGGDRWYVTAVELVRPDEILRP